MKKRFGALLLLGVLMLAMVSCAAREEYTVSLADEPIVEDRIMKTGGEMTIHFEFPEAGCIKMLAYDATDYKNEPEKYPSPTVSFYNEKGVAVYEGLDIENGYFEKTHFSKGKVTAKITFAGAKKMEKAGIYWAFASDTKEPAKVGINQPAAMVTDGAGEARFIFHAEKAGLYYIRCQEAGVWESDCAFEVYNVSEQTMAGRLEIHGTEWNQRTVFLQPGDYKINTYDVEGIAKLFIEAESDYGQVIPAGSATAALPATIGFSYDLPQSQTATFTLDGGKLRLWASATGSEHFYDSMQRFTLVVRDAAGNEIAREENAEDSAVIDLKGRKGTFTVEVSNVGNGVVYLTLGE